MCVCFFLGGFFAVIMTRDKYLSLYIYIYTHTQTYVCVYIYITLFTLFGQSSLVRLQPIPAPN